MKKICLALLAIMLLSMTSVAVAKIQAPQEDEFGHLWYERGGKFVCQGDAEKGHGPNCKKIK